MVLCILGIVWWAGPKKSQSFESDILMDESVAMFKTALSSVTKGNFTVY